MIAIRLRCPKALATAIPPPYLQVANHLRAAILTGTYIAGDRLPSVAQLTEQLGVSPMTVKEGRSASFGTRTW